MTDGVAHETLGFRPVSYQLVTVVTYLSIGYAGVVRLALYLILFHL